ncbi:(2Fe-2S)-binding protein [Streptomyces alkaliterrae]|uniref:(2Fe-2S)-binding protein n=1 Tax=Streptomyces alkaliterrae TaxID=2213162 RepID=A0A5P0YSD8_9ACTN|nr:(2Fe-2S)-binding protein [Streptomyces alkaliterrae]MBB1254771.1 (2Fe-2S)-binding protein [Streptomyces alkaliterrae]MBB1261164.1 (2Fe-2S)-binding protein [Streptomyces alkaliterrae]MQS03244.1 iron-sulfur protein [Streptomyces alkaliterrae]
MLAASHATVTAADPGRPPTHDALLTQMYQPLAALFPPLILRTTADQPTPGALTARGLAERPQVPRALAEGAAERLAATFGRRPREDVAAAEALHQYAFVACLTMSGPWHLQRRVPHLSPDAFALDLDALVVTVAPERVTCLPGDPAEHLPGVRVVADEAALRRELRAAVRDHLGPALQAFGPLLRRGPRGLWALATDELAEGLAHLGGLLGDRAAGARAANSLLPGGTPPYAGAADYRLPPADVTTAGEAEACEPPAEPTRVRASCCLYYTLAPDRLCAGCPRTRRN